MGFFDDLGDTLFEAGKTVSQKAKDTADVAKLSYELKEAEMKARDLYAELGRHYYAEHKDDPDQDFSELNAALEKIAELKGDVNDRRGTQKCPKCGAIVPKDAAFCSKCGAKLNDIFED